jgi:hypothetical protein
MFPLFSNPDLSETEARYKYVLEVENVLLKLGNALKNLKPVVCTFEFNFHVLKNGKYSLKSIKFCMRTGHI